MLGDSWCPTEGACKLVEQGDFVEVVRAVSETERTLLGRRFRVARLDRTHGYAVCSDEHGSWHLHPEALRILGPEENVP